MSVAWDNWHAETFHNPPDWARLDAQSAYFERLFPKSNNVVDSTGDTDPLTTPAPDGLGYTPLVGLLF